MIRNRRRREDIYSTPDYWDAKAEEYGDTSVSMWPNNHLNYYYDLEQQRVMKKYLPAGSGLKHLKVLDVGCGTGRVSRFLAQQGAEVMGIDFSRKAVELAAKQTNANGPCFAVQSMFDLQENEVYDLAVAFASLTVACKQRADLLNALVRIQRALKRDGNLFLLEPVNRGLLHRVLNMNIKDFCRTIEEAGFSIEAVTHLHFWPVRLLLAYFPIPKCITAPAFYLGELIMRLFKYRRFGDYKAIYASITREDVG